jgi:hypothetical protein
VQRARACRSHGRPLGARHGTAADRACHRIADEIPKQAYAEIVRLLLDAGAPVPERVGENGARAATLIAELGIDPST